MGLRKQQKKGQASDWISPTDMLSQLGGPAGQGMPTQAGTRPVPAGLRPLTATGPQGDWLPGALHLAPGSILWQPGAGIRAEPVELAAARIMPPQANWQGKGQGKARGKAGLVTNLETPAGWLQLDMDPVLFEMSQELVFGTDGGPGPGSAPPAF